MIDRFLNWNERRYAPLGVKLLITLLIAALLAAATFFACTALENFIANKLYLSKSAKERLVNEKYDSLALFITQNDVEGKDVKAMRNWIKSEKYTRILVYDNKKDYFSSDWGADGQNATSGAGTGSTLTIVENKDDAASSNVEDKRIQGESFKEDLYNRIIKFTDAEYYVFIDVYSEQRWYSIMNIVAVVLAAIVFIIVVLVYNGFVVRRIKTLSDEVRLISEGDLDRKITVERNDEIKILASSVDTMRNSIIQKMGSEKEAWDANAQLVTAMSHDIRTPLTSLIGYLDIIEGRKFESYEELNKYIENCRDKAFQLKELSDKLFRYFLVFGNQEMDKEMEVMDGGILFQQMFIDHVAEAVSRGVTVNMQYDIPENAMVKVDISSMQRLFDNLFSNIMKYANTAFPCEIKAHLDGDRIRILIQNQIWEEAKKVDSTKIGVKTCKKICEDMGGVFRATEEEKVYTTEILFPLYQESQDGSSGASETSQGGEAESAGAGAAAEDSGGI